jgi:hypothetical protein
VCGVGEGGSAMNDTTLRVGFLLIFALLMLAGAQEGKRG